MTSNVNTATTTSDIYNSDSAFDSEFAQLKDELAQLSLRVEDTIVKTDLCAAMIASFTNSTKVAV